MLNSHGFRVNYATLDKAKWAVSAYLVEGYQNLIAEVSDDEGEVVAYYELGWSTS